MGLLRALHKRGLRVQPFKCGPDYIDTQFHTLAADHESVNLDTWMASNTHVQHLYNKYGDGADVCVTEGVMGLFDGYQRMQGSSAEIAIVEYPCSAYSKCAFYSLFCGSVNLWLQAF